jgi:hypothetical protein
MPKYGDYNGDLTEKKRDSLDTENTPVSNAIKGVIVKSYSETPVKSGPYVGFVLRVDEQDLPWYSVFKSSWSAKVRIPELDAHIPEPSEYPEPSDENDITLIEMHPTYLPKGDDVEDKPIAGAKVLVERDPNGRSNYILEVLDKESKSTETPGEGSGPKSAHGGGSGSSGGSSGNGKRYLGGSRDNEKNEDGLTGFRRYKFRQPPDTILIHESGSSSENGTVNILKKKGLGVHFMASQGRIIQFEGIDHYLIHCPKFNRRSIGLEFNHAYHGKENLLKPARFYWKSKYNIPTVLQLETCYSMVFHVCEITGIPLDMPQLKDGKFTFKGGVGANMSTGVVSHIAASPNHGDGNYPCLYMALRVAGNSPQESWDIAYEFAKIARGNSSCVIPVGSSNPLPPKAVIETKLPMTYAERKAYPKYA